MPLSALPERLQNPANWKGTDMDNWYQRWILKYIHGWFAYGPRATQWWAKWKRFPVVLFKARGQGTWRYEADNTEEDISLDRTPYLSRIQYYTRWHFQIQWPFFIAFHCYFHAGDVPVTWNRMLNTDGKLFYFYFGAHRDADVVYWFPSAFIGLVWK